MKEISLCFIRLMTEIKFRDFFVQLKSQQGHNVKKVNLKVTARDQHITTNSESFP
jgi:hypothetical protein